MSETVYINPNNGNHRLIVLLLILLCFFFIITSCKTKEKLVEKSEEIYTNETNVVNKDSIIDVLRSDNFSKTEYITVIEKVLENTVTGNVGEVKDTNSIIKNITLTNNTDTVFLSGDWHKLSWRWKAGGSKDVTKFKNDSSSLVINRYKEVNNILRKQNISITKNIRTLEERVTKWKTNFKVVLAALALGIVVGIIMYLRWK